MQARGRLHKACKQVESMKRFWFFAIALFLLWLDIFILSGRAYPKYEMDMNRGRAGQKMIMEDVVGTELPIDIASDIPALLIMIVLVVMGGPAVTPFQVEDAPHGKQKYIPNGKAQVLGERSRRFDIQAIVACVLAIDAILVIRLCPFYVNGFTCYAIEYLTHLADVFLPLAAVFFVFTEFIRRTGIRTTRRETDISGFAMMISLFFGFLARFASLYGYPFIFYPAWILEGGLMLIALVLHYISLRENGRKLQYPDPNPEENPDYKFEDEQEWNFPFHFPFAK